MIELRDVSKSFREPNGKERIIFKDLNFHIPVGAGSAAILGRSGAGKTTLLRILAGLDIDYSGSYLYSGSLLPKRSSVMAAHRLSSIGYITQYYDLLSDRNVLHNVAMGTSYNPNAITHAYMCLELVGLPDFGKKHIRDLSGGEAQRVAIARALVKNPRIVLADEPSGAMDEETENSMLDLFDTCKSKGIIIIIATHNHAVANRCDVRFSIENNRMKLI